MTARLTVLIVGGYGTFGGRLAELLKDEPRFDLLIAGRSLERAQLWCAAHPSEARLVPVAFDRSGAIEAQLGAVKPDWVVDASGPFQLYEGDPYGLVRACIGQGIDYLDLADASSFVEGVAALDEAARASGSVVLSGASSFPVLTAAVVRALAPDFARIESVTGGIAPSPFAGVGENVIRAIVAYAGQKVPIVRDGTRGFGYPLTETRRYTIAPPGRLPLVSTLFSLVDVPDLRAIPALWPEARTVWMGAGPVPAILHRLLILCAWTVRIGLVPGLGRLVPLMRWASNRLRWGEHRGGMFVEVAGLHESGSQVRRSWHLVAEGDDGPLIPSMAAAILLTDALQGKLRPAGAGSAATAIELGDYGPWFRSRRIEWGFRARPAAAGLYPGLLGCAWGRLPAPVRTMHDLPAPARASGRASVERGGSLAARIVARLVGFPDGADDLPVTVAFTPDGAGGELWVRDFAGRRFRSRQSAGEGRFEHLLIERFGPLAFAMALVLEGDRLRLVLRHWSLLGLPLPLRLGPRADAYEEAADGRFRFHVEIRHPLAGLIVRYKGWLVRD
jgi:hypothetical protein